MKKNNFLIILLFIFSIFLNIYFFIGKINIKKSNISKNSNIFTGSKINIKKSNISKNSNNFSGNNVVVKKQIELKDILKSEKPFNYFLNNISDKYNLVNILIKEFQKVNNKEDYLEFRKKFGGNVLLYTFIKTENIQLVNKYMNYYLKYDLNFNEKKKEYLLKTIDKILKEYYEKGYFNSLGYKDTDGTYDYFRLSLMNYSLDKKIKICREGFKKEDDFNSCKIVVIYMAANKKNGYCEKMDKEYYKKWCSDTLEYLDKNK